MLAWEWTLPTGQKVVAKADAATRVESVFLGPRLVSRSPAGGKPEGHVLPRGDNDGGPYRGQSEIRVVFGSTCRLILEGKELEGRSLPSNSATGKPSPKRNLLYIGVISMVCVLIVVLGLRLAKKPRGSRCVEDDECRSNHCEEIGWGISARTCVR
jgi:hypothetical protein